MLNENQVSDVIGSTAYGSDGEKIGKVGQVYFDENTDQPEWVTVNTGLFGTSESFIPLSDATFEGDRLTVSHTKDKVKGAPNVGNDGHLSPEEERALYDYYGRGWGDYDTTTTTSTDVSNVHGTEGYDVSGPTTDDAMTRSEERLRVGTTSQEAGRARLRKWVETENVSQTVPVSRERAVLQTEPITDANIGDATAGPEISSEEHEVILHEEVPVVEKTVEPVERVRLGTETVTEQQTVTEQVRSEQIDVDGDRDVDTSR
jgi:stress response protein YsnF